MCTFQWDGSADQRLLPINMAVVFTFLQYPIQLDAYWWFQHSALSFPFNTQLYFLYWLCFRSKKNLAVVIIFVLIGQSKFSFSSITTGRQKMSGIVACCLITLLCLHVYIYSWEQGCRMTDMFIIVMGQELKGGVIPTEDIEGWSHRYWANVRLLTSHGIIQ